MRNTTILHGSTPVELDVPPQVKAMIPRPYGYGTEEFTADVVNAFSPAPGERKEFRDVAYSWERASILNSRDPEMLGLWKAKDLAAQYSKTMSRLSHSPIRQELLDACEGDAERAAEAFFQIMAGQQQHQPQRGQGTQVMDKIIDNEGGNLKLPFGALGPQGGSGTTAQLIAKAYRIGELLKTLRLQYKPYSNRMTGKEEVDFPVDIDIEPLRDWSLRNLSRLCLSGLMQDDDQFYLNLAERKLLQVTYQQPIPGPPKMFVMLLDVSGSMAEEIHGTGFQRAEYAHASAVALLEQALSGGHEVKLMRFSYDAYPPISGTPAQIVRELLDAKADDGGTSITNALKAADTHNPDEIILITDGEDNVEYTPKAPLTTYLCGDGRNLSLKPISRSFQVVK